MTVQELIDALSKLPRNVPVVIDDADTNWELNIKSVNNWDDHVSIGGEYYGDDALWSK